MAAFAELHCHSHFSFLDGASAPDELVERAVELGFSALAVTDHQGLYGVVRFASAAREVGLHPIVGVEVELLDAAVPDPLGIVVPSSRRGRGGPRAVVPPTAATVAHEGLPARPRSARLRLPGHRRVVKEDLRGIGEASRGPHLVLLARNASGYRSLCRLVSRANLAGTKTVPRFTQALLAEHTEGVIALSGCRESEIARRLLVGDRDGARAVAERYAQAFGRAAGRNAGSGATGSGPFGGLVLELEHHLLPDDDWLVAETARLAAEVGLPVVVTNDVHYARPEGRELTDVLTAIRHGRTLDTLGDLRRPDGESYLKSAIELAALPPAEADAATARAWAEGLTTAGEIARACSVDLGFEQYRFPGFPVPKGETAFSYLEQLCHEGVRRRYHPVTPSVIRQLAHELDVIEKTKLAEFFLICWDLMRFARENHIPAQGRGSAADSIVAYVLGITRVDPIRHRLLFERFINEGRTTYPDVDIDFSSERREEVIQYVYNRYGEEHTGMVCNLVTYRARSAVREIGYALGFPRPLVDRVAKALETYDSVMVRRDLEAEGGFGQFFARPEDGRPGEAEAHGPVAAAASRAAAHGLTDDMGQLNHERGGRIATGMRDEHGNGRLVRREDVGRVEAPPALAVGESLTAAASPTPQFRPLAGREAAVGPAAAARTEAPQAFDEAATAASGSRNPEDYGGGEIGPGKKALSLAVPATQSEGQGERHGPADQAVAERTARTDRNGGLPSGPEDRYLSARAVDYRGAGIGEGKRTRSGLAPERAADPRQASCRSPGASRLDALALADTASRTRNRRNAFSAARPRHSGQSRAQASRSSAARGAYRCPHQRQSNGADGEVSGSISWTDPRRPATSFRRAPRPGSRQGP